MSGPDLNESHAIVGGVSSAATGLVVALAKLLKRPAEKVEAKLLREVLGEVKGMRSDLADLRGEVAELRGEVKANKERHDDFAKHAEKSLESHRDDLEYLKKEVVRLATQLEERTAHR